jgi:Zn-dependent protease
MFSKRWQLFRLVGIPINIDASWLIILALLTWTLASEFVHDLGDSLSISSSWLLALAAALGFFACIILHELGHAIVARSVGIPIRGITLFLFGGVAEMEGEPNSAAGEFAMAIAGPVVSALLAVLFWLASLLELASPAVLIFHYLFVINLSVLVFNLIPAFPLDGGRVLRSIIWGLSANLEQSTYYASLLGQGFAWVLMGLGLVAVFAGAIMQGIWLGLIGMFLNSAARGSYQQVVMRHLLQGEPVSRFMNPAPIVVPMNLDLRHLVEDYIYRYHHKMFPVADDGHVAGVVGTEALARYPRDEWDRHTVAEAMQTDLRGLRVRPDTDALDALARMQRMDSSRLLVMDHERVVGIVSLKDLLRFLELKLELEDTNN